jgi:hypothetical protein
VRAYGEVCRRFHEGRVPYVIVGVFGANLHAQQAGLVVTTADCDLLLPPDPKVLARALRVLRKLRFTLSAGGEGIPDEDPVLMDGIVRARACVQAVRGIVRIDLALEIAGYTFERLWNRRRRFRLGGAVVHVAPLEDILRSKELAGRDKDKLFLATYRDALEQLLDPKPLARGAPARRRRREK